MQRYTDTGRATLVPLMTEAGTDRIRNVDLEVTPHLLISGYSGWGATSALRLLAVHAARNGMEVQVLTPKRVGFTGLDGAEGIRVHRDPDAIAQAVTDFTAELDAEILRRDAAGIFDVTARRLLVVDGLDRLRSTLAGTGADRRPIPAALEDVALLGRVAGYHLAASASVTGVPFLPVALRDCSAVLTLGPTGNRVRRELVGAEPRTPGVPAGRGGGEFADYDGPRPVRTVFVDESEARRLVTH
ncbi:hypothetical protein [Streptomyces sp. NPDC088925]|uniref:hypothetical protein n=1 Tax=Streptomyces sp. NPDC088925 TaxID=3365914 RepID=UPI00381DBE32